MSASVMEGNDMINLPMTGGYLRKKSHSAHRIVSQRVEFLDYDLMRLTFLDEAGRSRHEPIIVVAGIIVHGDRLYRRLRIGYARSLEMPFLRARRMRRSYMRLICFMATVSFTERKWPGTNDTPS